MASADGTVIEQECRCRDQDGHERQCSSDGTGRECCPDVAGMMIPWHGTTDARPCPHLCYAEPTGFAACLDLMGGR
jgi:hypothetical protein